MFQLKLISKDTIPRALAKAERYRLLNEPQEAESICLDILCVEPDHHEALVMLLLAITSPGWFIEALDFYEKARALSPPGNDDATLRWNACVRLLEKSPELTALAAEAAAESGFSE